MPKVPCLPPQPPLPSLHPHSFSHSAPIHISASLASVPSPAGSLPSFPPRRCISAALPLSGLASSAAARRTTPPSPLFSCSDPSLIHLAGPIFRPTPATVPPIGPFLRGGRNRSASPRHVPFCRHLRVVRRRGRGAAAVDRSAPPAAGAYAETRAEPPGGRPVPPRRPPTKGEASDTLTDAYVRPAAAAARLC